jgi:hypothetical protein
MEGALGPAGRTAAIPGLQPEAMVFETGADDPLDRNEQARWLPARH